MESGHQKAQYYSIGNLLYESNIVRKRINRQIASEVTATRLAISSIFINENMKDYQKMIKDLQE